MERSLETKRQQVMKEKVYSSSSELKNLRQFARNLLHDALSSSYLAYRMSQRDIKAQFRQTFLGLFDGTTADKYGWLDYV